MQTQTFDCFDKGRLQIDGIANQQTRERALTGPPDPATRPVRKALPPHHPSGSENAQRDRERVLTITTATIPMVVLGVGAQHAACASGAGRFHSRGPDRFGGLALQGIADGVVADGSIRLASAPPLHFGFDLQQTGDLHGRAQEDGIEHFMPRMLRSMPLRATLLPAGRSQTPCRDRFELATGQGLGFLFRLENLRRLMAQMVAAAASKRCRIATCWRTCSTFWRGR